MEVNRNNPKHRVIIVEDDVLVLNSMVEYLSLHGYVVTGVGSAVEFYSQINLQTYAVAILDIGLPDQNGIVLCEYLRKNSKTRIIMYTARASIDDKIAGHKAGADTYLVKPVDFRELAMAIESLVGRLNESGAETVPPLAQQGVSQSAMPVSWRLVPGKWTLHTTFGGQINLTPKELDFITLLCRDRSTPSRRLDILKHLGYFNNESGNNSLESLVRRLRSKISRLNIEPPIQTVHGVGYSFIGDISVE
ncbi:MAG: response regulator transcription factor [Chlorobiaceae bacterium]|nr:response regulator transcription factor [Chlorobiaceae bacterium]